MRRILLWVVATVTVLVLLFSYRTSTSSTMAASQQTGATTPAADRASLSVSGPVDGDAVPTRFGVVQVRITVQDGRIASAEALQVPYRDRRDQEINARAVPLLAAQTVQRQSAQLDAVSGATLTSVGYMQSLQSAIDRASA